MNGGTAKLLNEAARLTGRKAKSLKRAYKKMPVEIRGEFLDNLKAAIEKNDGKIHKGEENDRASRRGKGHTTK